MDVRRDVGRIEVPSFTDCQLGEESTHDGRETKAGIPSQ